jgi:hypothetical protein
MHSRRRRPEASPNASTVPGSFDFTGLSRARRLTQRTTASHCTQNHLAPAGWQQSTSPAIISGMASICNKMSELLEIYVAAAVRKVLQQSGYFEPSSIEPCNVALIFASSSPVIGTPRGIPPDNSIPNFLQSLGRLLQDLKSGQKTT